MKRTLPALACWLVFVGWLILTGDSRDLWVRIVGVALFIIAAWESYVLL